MKMQILRIPEAEHAFDKLEMLNKRASDAVARIAR